MMKYKKEAKKNMGNITEARGHIEKQASKQGGKESSTESQCAGNERVVRGVGNTGG